MPACPDGQVCINGACTCKDPGTCADGKCDPMVPIDPDCVLPCMIDTNCPTGQWCNAGDCQCKDPNVPCIGDAVCDPMQGPLDPDCPDGICDPKNPYDPDCM